MSFPWVIHIFISSVKKKAKYFFNISGTPSCSHCISPFLEVQSLKFAGDKWQLFHIVHISKLQHFIFHFCQMCSNEKFDGAHLWCVQLWMQLLLRCKCETCQYWQDLARTNWNIAEPLCVWEKDYNFRTSLLPEAQQIFLFVCKLTTPIYLRLDILFLKMGIKSINEWVIYKIAINQFKLVCQYHLGYHLKKYRSKLSEFKWLVGFTLYLVTLRDTQDTGHRTGIFLLN